MSEIIRIGRGKYWVDLPSGMTNAVRGNSFWSGFYMDWRYVQGQTPGTFRDMGVPDYRVRMMFYPQAGGSIGVFLRRIDRSNFYHLYYYYDASTGTKYMRISRMVNAVETVLASTTITYSVLLFLEGECVGSTLNMLWGTRLPLTTVNLTATDTTFTEPGSAGAGQWGEGIHGLSGSWVETLETSTDVPIPRQWIEAPLAGTGKPFSDPYRPSLQPVITGYKLVVTDPVRHAVVKKIADKLGLEEWEAGLLYGTAHRVALPAHRCKYTAFAPLDRKTGKPASDTFLVGLIHPVGDDKLLSRMAPSHRKVADPVKWLRQHGMNDEARILRERMRKKRVNTNDKVSSTAKR